MDVFDRILTEVMLATSAKSYGEIIDKWKEIHRGVSMMGADIKKLEIQNGTIYNIMIFFSVFLNVMQLLLTH